MGIDEGEWGIKLRKGPSYHEFMSPKVSVNPYLETRNAFSERLSY